MPPVKRVRFITSGQHAGMRLDHVLAQSLPQTLGRPVSKAKLRKLVMAGAVYLNGRAVRDAAKPLPAGATIEAFIDLAKLFHDATARDKKFELTSDGILFEDEYLIVIDKPSGLPTHPTADATRDNLVAAVKRFLSRRDGLENPYVGIHQRLDRDTSGIVLFTKTPQVNAAVADLFANHRAVKTYHALTQPRPGSGPASKPQREWTIRNRLGKASSKDKRARYGAVRSAGLDAETSFRVLDEHPGGIWIQAIPKTGRTHQIRVHLSEYGLPILGDDLYGDAEKTAPRLMLHAVELRFPHPITQRELCVTSPVPPDFAKCLSREAAKESSPRRKGLGTASGNGDGGPRPPRR